LETLLGKGAALRARDLVALNAALKAAGLAEIAPEK